MLYNLFLDDQRKPNEAIYWECAEDGEQFVIEALTVDWVIVKSYEEFVSTITMRGMPIRISFDHDLHPEHYSDGYAGLSPQYHVYKNKTGLDCAEWLVAHCKRNKLTMPLCYVHSFNTIGRNNIFSMLCKNHTN